MLLVLTFAQNEKEFIYNGFHGAFNLHLDGLANILPRGLPQMTNLSIHKTAHAFYLILLLSGLIKHSLSLLFLLCILK